MRGRSFGWFGFGMCILLCLLFMMSAGVGVLFAQDNTPQAFPTPALLVTPDAPVAPPPVVTSGEAPPPVAAIDLGSALERLMAFVANLVADAPTSLMLVPLVTAIVGVVKYVPFVRDKIQAGTFSVALLTFVVSAILWMLAALAGQYGYASQFGSAAGWIVQMLPTTVQLLAVLTGSKLLHEIAANYNVPVLGKKVTPDVLALSGDTEMAGGVQSMGDTLQWGWDSAFTRRYTSSPYVTVEDLNAMVPNLLDQAVDRAVQKWAGSHG